MFQIVILIAAMLLATPTSAQQQQPLVSYPEIQTQYPEVSGVIDILSEASAIASKGPLTSGFAPFGIILEIGQVEYDLSQRTEMCDAIRGKSILYDKNGDGKEIYRVTRNYVGDSCSIKLLRLSDNEIDEEYIYLSRSLDSEHRLPADITGSNGTFSEVRVYANGFDEIVEVRFFKEVKVPQSLLNLGFAINPDADGNQNEMYFKFNFPLERGIRID